MKYYTTSFVNPANKGFISNDEGVVPKGFGDAAEAIDSEINGVNEHYTLPISSNELQQKFKRLAATWEYNNDFISSIEKMILLPEYQEIIGMGEAVVPFILREMQQEPGYWFWALKSITGEDPVEPEDRGKLLEMTNAWINWGKDNGYI